MSGSEIARRFDSPIMLSRIAAQKAAEHVSQDALASVARLKASLSAGPSPAARSAGTGKSGLARNGPPGCVLRTAQTVSSHTPNRKPNWSHSANTARADRLMAIFHGIKLVGAWMIVEGRGNNRVRGEKGLECDMVGGQQGCDLGVGCTAHNTGWVTWGWGKMGLSKRVFELEEALVKHQ